MSDILARNFCGYDTAFFTSDGEAVFTVTSTSSDTEVDASSLQTVDAVSGYTDPDSDNFRGLVYADGYSIGLPSFSDINIDASSIESSSILVFCMPNFQTNYYGPPQNPLRDVSQATEDPDAMYVDVLGTVYTISELLQSLYAVYPDTNKIYRYILPYRLYTDDWEIIDYDQRTGGGTGNGSGGGNGGTGNGSGGGNGGTGNGSGSGNGTGGTDLSPWIIALGVVELIALVVVVIVTVAAFLI